jgi:HK97 family phage portal protein
MLYLPRGEVIYKNSGPDAVLTGPTRSSFSITGMSPSQLGGATPKAYDYKLLLLMYQRHPIVRAAIDKIAKSATNTGFEYVPRDSRSKVKQAEFEILKGFFDEQSNLIGMWRRVYKDLLIFGDAFVYIIPNRRRQPSLLKRLAPWTMHAKVDKQGNVIGYVQKDPEKPRAESVEYKEIEIMHFKIDDPANDLYGLSPLDSIKLTVTADLEASKWNKNFFKNGASTGTVFLLDGDISDDELKRAREHIRDVYAGTENAHLPVVITGASKIDRSVTTHAEMGFLQGRDYLKKEILAVLDVPPAKIGDMESANRSNSKEQDKTFRNESVSPLQHIVEETLNDHLVRRVLKVRDTRWQHSQSDVRDAQEQMDLHTDAVQNGIENINEVRAQMGYAPIEGGDINFIMTPTGAVPVVDMELYFRLPRENTDDIPPEAQPQGVADGTPGPSTVGPNPKPTANVETGQRPTSKAHARAMWVEALERGDRHPLFTRAAKMFEQSVKTDDADLSLAYYERGHAIFQQIDKSLITTQEDADEDADP